MKRILLCLLLPLVLCFPADGRPRRHTGSSGNQSFQNGNFVPNKFPAAIDVPTLGKQFAELLNAARADPVAYQHRTQMPVSLAGVAKRGPLVWDDRLAKSATLHAEDLARRQVVSHMCLFQGRYWPPNWIVRHWGRYPLPANWPDYANYVESVTGGFPTAESCLYALVQDYGVPGYGHRVHLMGQGGFASHRRIGAAAALSPNGLYYWVIHTAP